ncbi:class I SAM-dependent methyltransferase [Saccharopolyspora erythraea]|nr:class I SAM-dependent methyltransferase [Saccharopolyspora erythraea]
MPTPKAEPRPTTREEAAVPQDQSMAAIYRGYLDGATPAGMTGHITGADSALHLAVWSHAVGDRHTAHACAVRAAELDPASEFARLLVRFTAGPDTGDVYDSPAAFQAFIRGGGNIALYEATSAALRHAHQRHRPHRLLDIGAGDGLALLPALDDDAPHVDVVEPSADLLAHTRDALRRRGISHQVWNCTVQDFAAAHPDRQWDLAQSTFALQSVPPHQRPAILQWLAQHTRTFVLVEFDVPEVPEPLAPDWFGEFLRRVERGVREYDDDRDLVGLGFILPVVLGKFGTTDRTNHEQSIQDWTAQLRAAGFAEVTAHRLHDYWWQPAHVVEAHH